jgi:hypothetical protein
MKRPAKGKSKRPDIPTLSQLTQELDDNFFEALRRPPKSGDRLFYWTYCYSEPEISAITIAVMLRAGTPQRLIYIFDKTGFVVAKEGFKRLTREENRRRVLRRGMYIEHWNNKTAGFRPPLLSQRMPGSSPA